MLKYALIFLLGKQYMSTRRTDSAFPVSYSRDTDRLVEGMTKREYFAITIMQGLTAANVKFEDEYQKARLAVSEADALIDILAYEANPKS
jgi:hypothetical protein